MLFRSRLVQIAIAADYTIAGVMQFDERKVAYLRRDANETVLVLANLSRSLQPAEIDLSGGYRLTLFPAGSTGEDWRLFRPSEGEEDTPHFVVTGGRIEDPE